MKDDLVARCDREIREIQERPEECGPHDWAYLPSMGLMDWQIERDLIRTGESLRLIAR